MWYSFFLQQDYNQGRDTSSSTSYGPFTFPLEIFFVTFSREPSSDTKLRKVLTTFYHYLKPYLSIVGRVHTTTYFLSDNFWMSALAKDHLRVLLFKSSQTVRYKTTNIGLTLNNCKTWIPPSYGWPQSLVHPIWYVWHLQLYLSDV